MQDVASVLRVRNFVQMAAAAQIKFKMSVACPLHPAPQDPDPEPAKPAQHYLPLTPVERPGFNRMKGGE
jgi:hypothetical protein